MSKITFPGFNLEFNISSIALQIGILQIHWYAICIVFGIALSLILMYFTKKKYGIKYEDLLEIFIFILIIGIIGARLFYVLFHLDYYSNHMNEILKIQNGGLAIYGGIISGIITAILACKIKKIEFFNFSNYVAPYLALSQGIGRLGNFFNVEAYGAETSCIFRMGIETINGYIEVHPCFLYEMVCCFLLFFVLKRVKKSFNLYLILYGIIRFFVESLRVDSLMLGTLKVSKIVSLIFIVIGVSLYIIDEIRCRKNANLVDEK